MEPEPSTARQKSTGRSDQSPGRKSSRGEVSPSSVRPTVAYQPVQLHPQGSLSGNIVPPQSCFPGSLQLVTERAHQQAPAPDQPKHTSAYSYEQSRHASPQLLQQPMPPAFMAPVKPDLGLERRSWQLFDPSGPVASGSFIHTGLHSHGHLQPSHSAIIPKEEPQSAQPVYGHHAPQVSLKQEEALRKDKKPQKPGKYICQFCGRPCAKPSVLQKHIRSHTGERPYPCHSCGFSFKTKSNLYKHRKSHAHKLKAGLVTGTKGEMFTSTSGLELEKLSGEEAEEHTEGDESTDSEDETSGMSGHSLDLTSKHKHISGSTSFGTQELSPRQVAFTLAQQSETPSLEEGSQVSESSLDFSFSHKPEDSHTIKQKLALRLSERRKALADEQSQTFLSPGSKGSTESGYFSRSESAELQISPPQKSAKSYAEIILGKYGRYGQKTSMIAASATQRTQQMASEDKPGALSFSVPKAQMEQNVIEHITKLITINEAVVDTSQIDSVKPRRTSLSRRGSIESPKPCTSRESFQFDLKSLGSSSLGSDPSRHAFSAGRHAHSATETVPLTRSNSMPSASSTCFPPTFKGSYSFDDRMTDPEQAFSHSQRLISQHRMLKRQKAIELPSGMEYQTEEAGYLGKETVTQQSKSGEEQEPAETDPTKKTKKGPRVKGLMYECEICGARYRKRNNYETHKKYYCSELHAPRTRPYLAHVPRETEHRALPHDMQPQIVHYKLRPSLELTPARKRRKEKSLGDDEETPSDYSSRSTSSSVAVPSASSSTGVGQPSILLSSQTASRPTVMTLPIAKSESTQAAEASLDPGIRARLTSTESLSQALSSDSGSKRTTGKEISVIQHTNALSRPSSFEKSESLEQLGSVCSQESLPIEHPSQTAKIEPTVSWQPVSQHPRHQPHHHHHPLQARLVRQRKIQVPEILVTEEPDKLEKKEAGAKEPEKTPEEFQWPQRSQTLSQFPTEKLPPKKKRLRLAEMSQSSGESSFESVTLARSPSQESSVSHASSRSASFEREEHCKPEATSLKELAGQLPEIHVRPRGSHMLTVPAHYHHQREMRRSSSEQASSGQHPSEESEARSKSFDYGSLSFESSSGSKLPSPLKERRRCFLVRQTSLSGYTESEQEAKSLSKHEQVHALSKSSVHGSHYRSPPPPPLPHCCQPSVSQLQSDTAQVFYTQPPIEAFQAFQQPLPQAVPQQKQYLQQQLSPFPGQHHLQQQGQISSLLSPPVMPEVLPNSTVLPHVPYPLFPTPQQSIRQAQLQAAQQIRQQPVELPVHPSSLPHVQRPAATSTSQTAFLPLRSQLAFQLQAEAGAHFREQKPPIHLSPPIRVPSHSPPYHSQPEYSSSSTALSSPVPSLGTTSLSVLQPSITEFPETLQPVVSLVVPVRVQTHMPTYGSAMYTTLSQMLVTQSVENPSAVVICRVEDSRPKGTLVRTPAMHGIGLDLAQMIAGHHRDFFQSSYLRIPLPMAERKGYIPLASSTEGTCGTDSYPSTIGGSKRMLSPAGSLELTMETQQQKRVKEEEIEEESEESTELVKHLSATHSRAEDAAKLQKPQPPRQHPAESKASSTQTFQEWDSSSKQTLSLLHSPLQSPGPSEKYKPWPGHQYRNKPPLGSVKKEDSQEMVQERGPLHMQESQQLTASTLPEPPTSPSPAKPSTEVSDIQQVQHFPSLHTTTNVSWCYLKYTKPNPVQQTDPQSSVYGSWCISLYNPNLPGMSTKISLALLRSKQKTSKEIYTMAAVPQRETGKLVPSSTRKFRVSEIHSPTLLPGDGRKEVCKIEKEEERRETHEEDTSTPKRVEPTRLKIFEGGYKSNEDYVYVRGRGRGKYVCEECGIRCKKPSMLKKHIRTHTDLRPYVCNYCNFAFKTKGNLTKHMKSKAHSKKCQEMGVTVALMEDVESEEGTSEEKLKKAEESEGTDLAEEHQFSDVEESDDDDDNDDDDEEEEEEEQFVKSSEIASPSQQTAGTASTSFRGETAVTSLETTSKQGSSLTSQYSLASYPVSSSQLHATQLTKSSESAMVPMCHSVSQAQLEGSISMPSLTSTEPFLMTRDAVLKRQTALSADASPSRDTSPRRPWSPKRETSPSSLLYPGGDIPSGKHSSPEREASVQEHMSPRKEMSPRRQFSPGRELSSKRCPSPGKSMSPKRRLSPGREVSPERCLSPRVEVLSGRVSPRTHLSPEREVSPGRTLSPGMRTLSSRYLSPARDVSPRRQLSSVRKESPLRHLSPVKDELPSRCLTPTWHSAQGSSFSSQYSGSSSSGLPPRISSKELEKSESKLKMSRMGYHGTHEEPSTSSQALHFFSSRNTQTALESQSYSGLTGTAQDYVFSHLPLHSQQLVRTPYPMIPIGGIQMVQSRPGFHSGLVPSPIVSRQSGFPVSLTAPCPFSANKTEATKHLEEDVLLRPKSAEATTSKSLPLLLPSAPTTPVSSRARSSKQCVTLQRTETVELEEEEETYKQEEYRVPISSEPSTIAALSHSGQAAGSTRLDSPSTSHEHSPKPSTSGEGTSKDFSKKHFGSADTYYELARTLATKQSTHPLQGSSSSSSSECSSPSHSFQTGARRTASSGQCHLVRTQSGSSPECKGEGFVHLDTQKDNETGSS
ncbi:transcription factor HIVEP3 [Scyliorhinus canicula]|uniref:transcription factor HIVEP3 n=1 Tax=Scyliorhinus canicula TaxID=7830 RepID=UPI0018F72510|nr:transcription factor HIVEP3 [Scyliorhinus canicula]XP_038654983.1 transcription factor HIVEP3 [Scyliorhinus canicula]XP_038654990.1 transcription factor HIVEP3 [Scyliorhinus canicula]XP_038654997.1 transcription factor HIVEP3 [Scyliorhinus canicula]XP_038655005.1 transcription factor HIVEP3 [Scyliorhinus canicula]XP_038655015.1 transcription factor HIVEP3 [Scyliorhinus canicula]XP_038655024.1 transcription factor HIVEP3 [Scyliorhinus canicula]XP_038655033.1 transcription factor HIVEP3 [Sc